MCHNPVVSEPELHAFAIIVWPEFQSDMPEHITDISPTHSEAEDEPNCLTLLRRKLNNYLARRLPESHNELTLAPREPSESINTPCVICLNEITREATVHQLRCNHIFHHDCLAPWLSDHNDCPTCRNIVDPTRVMTHEQPANAWTLYDVDSSMSALARFYLIQYW